MRYILVAGSPDTCFDECYTYMPGDILIGIDLGCERIIDHNYPLALAIGDFDTTNRVEEIKAKAKQFVEYSPIKNEIDLELALKYLIGTKEEIIVYDALGARTDHELIAFKLLIKYKNLNITLVNKLEYISYLYKDTITLTDHNKRFSLIPFDDVFVSIEGAKYPLALTKLTISDNYTSSNSTLDKDTIIQCKNGGVILIREK